MESVELLRILDAIKSFSTNVDNKIESLIKDKKTSPIQSDKINELIAALAKARLDFTEPRKNKTVTYSGRSYNYADLFSIINSVAPALAKNGIAIAQQIIEEDGGGHVLYTRLLHSSGQWIENRTRIIASDKSHQSWGSAVTYQRRYNLMSILSVFPEDDPSDDDAVEADKVYSNKFEKGTLVQSKKEPKKEFITISSHQLDEIETALAEECFAEDLDKQLNWFYEKYEIRTLSDLPQIYYDEVITKIRNMALLRKGLVKP